MKKAKLYGALSVLLLINIICMVGPYISGHNAYEQNLDIIHQAPNKIFWFGTDSLGRDIFTRVCLGGRNSLLISFVCAIITAIIGCVYGGISAFSERLDKIMMSVLDVFASVPSILVVIIIPLWFESKRISVVIFAICITGWCKMARLTRNMLKPIRMADYVFVAKGFNKNSFYIVTRHMIPNVFSTILSRIVLSIPEFIFYESFLSYLGIGVQPPDTSWGNLISNAQSNFMFHPYQLLFSSLMLVLTMLSVTWIGEAIDSKDEKRCEQVVERNNIGTVLSQEENEECRSLLAVKNLSVYYFESSKESVEKVSFDIQQGEIVGLVGQSGCGKTTIARTLAGIIPLFYGNVSFDSSIVFDGSEINYASEKSLQKLYAKGGVSIVYQDAHAHLDPTMRIGKQIEECIRLKEKTSKIDVKKKALELLKEVGLESYGEKILTMYPYQLSGGIAQRVVIAMAISTEPKLLICDEPTASLDAVMKQQIVSMIKALAKERNTAILFITHELDIVKEVATKIIVMAEGKIEEIIKTNNLLESNNRITKQLIKAVPDAVYPSNDMHTEPTVLRVQHINYSYPRSEYKVLNDISFKLKRGETLGILGESGSGKTTLARVIAGHMYVDSGEIIKSEKIDRPQYIFQNAFSAFDPHIRIGESVLEGVKGCEAKQRQLLLEQLFTKVELDYSLIDRFPKELSIGQCQRAAIARTLAAKPELVICDEPTSALDTVNQKNVLNLLYQLIHKQKVTCIFISHDINVIRFMSDRIVVMYKGCFVEVAQTEELFKNPCHPYTRKLIFGKGSDVEVQEFSVDNKKLYSGCPYFSECKSRMLKCKNEQPKMQKLGKDSVNERHHHVACFLFEKEV